MSVIVVSVSLLGGIGLLAGVGLALAAKKFEVKTDKRISDIRDILPGANCGACGFSGCDAYAEAVVAGGAVTNLCSVGGKSTTAQVSEIMGVEAGNTEAFIARVMCQGSYDNCTIKFDYQGIEDCAAAGSLHRGPSSCSFGCEGIGNCVRACRFGAMIMQNGVAFVLKDKCTGCGMCIKACPKKIIKMVPEKSSYGVMCMNPEKGIQVTRVCKKGCIGCKRCEKACTFGAVKINGSLAEIEPALCIGCGACAEQCPKGTITAQNKCP